MIGAMAFPARILATLEAELAQRRPLLAELAATLAEHPEPPFAEQAASRRLQAVLAASGFTLEAPLAGLETAFRAELGRGVPALAVFLEYDAHPDGGHLAARPLTAAASVVALTALATVLSVLPGRLVVVGAPAAEPAAPNAGGKVLLLERGALDGIDAALILLATNARRPRLTSAPAGRLLELRFSGKASHAASAPERGVNALEAALGTFALLNSLRQHLPPGCRADGVIVHGGAAPNIVPERAVARFWLRAPGPATLRRLARRLLRAADGAAMAAGATVEHEDYCRPYPNVLDCPPLGQVAAEQWHAVWEVEPEGPSALPTPTDFGAVSQVVPSLALTLTVAGATLCTPEFAAAARRPEAQANALRAARVLARTAATLLLTPERIAAGARDLAARQERLRAFAARVGDS
ncbi:MAG: amidohydrolase [Dehalococcoidia bacterium]|nr:MAG: amidohydrolase [Dehalococcoidia bacterium]